MTSSISPFAAASSAGSILWATRAGSPDNDYGREVSTFADGSAVVVGEFRGTATFGGTTVSAISGLDAYIAKVDASGTFQWATRVGGSESQFSNGVTALADGSAIMTGYYTGDTAFPTTSGTISLTWSGDPATYDAFVARADRSGNFLWATQISGPNIRVYGVSALADGSAIVTGEFKVTATFGSTELEGGGGWDVFVAKVNASGAFEWATRAGGTDHDGGQGIVTLADGSALLTGYFNDAATFGSTTTTSDGGYDIFVAKVNSDGQFVWATRAGGTGYDSGVEISPFADGSALLTGYFSGTATFGSTELESGGGWDVFVAKVNASGAFEWATRAGGAGYGESTAISGLADGTALLTGYFSGTATFGSATLSASASEHAFVAKVDASGTFLWAVQSAGTGGEYGNDISALADGSAIMNGSFAGSATFGSTELTGAGNYDIFVAKVLSEPGAPAGISATTADGEATISWTAPALNGGDAITTYSVTGSPGGSCTTTAPTTTCTITGLTNGTSYTFNVTAANTIGTSTASTITAVPSAGLDVPDGALLFDGVGPELEPGTGEILEGDSWDEVSSRSSEVGSELIRVENEVVLQPVNDDGSPVVDDDYEIRLSGDCSGADCSIDTVTDADGVSREVMHLQTVNGVARATGSGFQPGTEVKLWLFSDPRSLGTATVKSDGTFDAEVSLDDVTPGEHTLQANGVTADFKARTAHVGVVLDPASVQLPATGGSSMAVAWALLVVSFGLIVLVVRRRPQAAS